MTTASSDPTQASAIDAGAIAAPETPAPAVASAGEMGARPWFLRWKAGDLLSLVSALVAVGSLALSIISANDAEESAARATQVATDALAAMQSLARAAERSADAAEAAAERQERIAAAAVKPSPQFRTRGDKVGLSMSNDGIGPAHISGMFFLLVDDGRTLAAGSYFMPDVNGAMASAAFQKVVTEHRELLVRNLPKPDGVTLRGFIFLGDLAVADEMPLLWAEGHPPTDDATVFNAFAPLMMAACTCNTFSGECSMILSAPELEHTPEWAAFHDRCLAPPENKHEP